MFATIRLAEFFDKGLLPVAGGLLDQSAWFLRFVERLQYEYALAEKDGQT